MAFELSQHLKHSFIAGADLTGSQYKFVKLNAAGQVITCTAITDVPIGVLQNAPRISEEAEVCIGGISKVVASAALAVDALIGTTAASTAVAVVPGTATTAYSVGRVITAASAVNELATAVIDCAAPGRAA